MKKKLLLALLITVLVMQTFTCFAASAAENENENLVKGMTYTVVFDAPIENAFPNLAYNDPSYALTDGKKASSGQYNDPAFICFYRGTYITVEFAFDSEVYVNGFSASFFGNAYGILVPREYYLSVSEDGENWYECISYRDDSLPSKNVKGRNVISKTADGYYKARFVRLRFASDVFTYCDELEIYGVRGGVNAQTHGYDEVSYPNAFTSPEKPILQGTRHVVLIYNSFTDTNTEEALMPYAAYVDNKGNIVSADMFDSFLFLPHRYSTPEGMTTAEGWASYLETTLGLEETPRNLAALEKDAEAISAALGTEVKYNVFLSIPENHENGSVFGKINGETVRLNNKENRLKALEWFVDLTMRRFEECNFKHLNFVGFYWFNETILFAETPNDFETVKEYNAYVHSKGVASVWIPYYCSPGFNLWEELGFDCACLQSGWAFPREADSETGAQKVEMLEDTMAVAKRYGMGLELEVASNAIKRFADYIDSAARIGCMKTGVSMYYQEALPGVFYKFSKTDRTNYDMLHQYINATYEQYAPEFDPPELLLVKTDSVDVTGNFKFTDPDSAKSKIRINSRTDPKHGKLSLDRDGFFVYNPEKGYSGEDSFAFTLTDGMNVSEEYVINIFVSPDVVRFDGINSKLRENKAILYDRSGSSTGSDPSLAGLIEFAVDSDGIVTAVSSEGDMQVPENGCVIAACGESAQKFTQIAKVGNKLRIDSVTKSVYLEIADDPEPSVSEPAVPEQSGGEQTSVPGSNENSSNAVLYIALAAAAVVAVAAAVVIKKLFFKGEEKK